MRLDHLLSKEIAGGEPADSGQSRDFEDLLFIFEGAAFKLGLIAQAVRARA